MPGFQLSGMEELQAALADLADDAGKGVAKAAMKRGLIDAAQPVADAARVLVPVKSGHLHDSITVSTKLSNPVGKAEYSATLRAGGTRAQAVSALRDARREASGNGGTVHVFVGPGPLPYAHLVEFGSVHNRPEPYLRPAWEQTKQQVLSSVSACVGAQITAAAERAARRRAKAAARGI
jgi:HK97 gp10 family phage protein